MTLAEHQAQHLSLALQFANKIARMPKGKKPSAHLFGLIQKDARRVTEATLRNCSQCKYLECDHCGKDTNSEGCKYFI